MKLAKNTHKKWSTWANLVVMTLGAAMIYLDRFADPKFMVACSIIVGACQWIKQGNLEDAQQD